jgi:2-polyprenyl-3-methyl-5-hydroxy-6-metoxy-1,4-benzoquinol methylase
MLAGSPRSDSRDQADQATALQRTRCPICETNASDRQVYAMNFDVRNLNAQVFSARRLPDRLHYRMVRCEQCGVLRSDPILPQSELARLYASSQFTYATEAEFAGATYARCLQRALTLVRQRQRLMEIGCGNGFLLREALNQGFEEVWGVEPSVDAVSQAGEDLRANILPGLYSSDTFPNEHFDVICGFQVLDHASDPGALLAACREDLKPGGVALFINHDCGALSARLLGESSPIIDVEHTVLFDKRTMRRIFEKCGFSVHDVFTVRNTYPLSYWAKLAPLPGRLKSLLLTLVGATGIGRIPVTLSAGNLGIIATKA